ncbi:MULTISPECIES: hypothetical protein [unclassified Nitratiruptor]|uniref:hypothetical protein n=1 Tax=unclassified Nitratiruptor TaxID=2624044 RepID=UPI0019154E97|nr:MULTISPECIES: hypothetical protein [unclassified Nitratiruptor]BCD59542.1 hypothetical protein NitYY0810_C0292 [Nitratiruptor sp. YY08-10]BCD63466.1 hypothetical protein NitYY0814_C0292 [Nitratiruptor sp. YY08-14]
MALKKIEDKTPISRFREFLEAREYIESFEKHEEDDVFAAIDYMLIHKEYHYLLRMILEHCQKPGIEKLSSYVFARLDCLKREEDKKLLQQLLLCKNNGIGKNVFTYILSCCEFMDVERLLKEYPISGEELQGLLEYGDCQSVRRFAEKLHDDLFERLRILEEFFELYHRKSENE